MVAIYLYHMSFSVYLKTVMFLINMMYRKEFSNSVILRLSYLKF